MWQYRMFYMLIKLHEHVQRGYLEGGWVGESDYPQVNQSQFKCYDTATMNKI
jgi:hypothetical protein